MHTCLAPLFSFILCVCVVDQSSPQCFCYAHSYELAERAEELGIITSVVGAHDIVPRVSWRALSYLKLLIKKALEETSIKKVNCKLLHVFTQYRVHAVRAHMYMYMSIVRVNN